MRRIKRLLNAPLRLRTSRGFGVHSPFAFSFILNVLKQRYSFYSYKNQVKRTKVARRHTGTVPASSVQHLVFRICNRFRPAVVFEIGHSCGLEAMAVIDSSTACKVMSYDHRPASPLFEHVTAHCRDRITIEPNFSSSVEEYNRLTTESTPMVMVNCAENIDTDRDFILSLLRRDGVAVFTNIKRDSVTSGLWEEVNDRLESHGMTFTNDRFGVIVGLSHLPRQRYKLWL
ncbi:MAG: hypothetical protein K2F80_06170 [Muribaculaceae bacterium]|nr:hypothetical protein [Muribaculaceae bacterium]